MNGAAVANEIRAIAAGLSGSKTVKAIEVRSLMIDTGAIARKAKAAIKAKGGSNRRRSKSNLGNLDNLDSSDRSSAENYYRAWKRSLETKLKDAGATETVIKPSPKAITKRSRRS